jgi:hypothetical protein
LIENYIFVKNDEIMHKKKFRLQHTLPTNVSNHQKYHQQQQPQQQVTPHPQAHKPSLQHQNKPNLRQNSNTPRTRSTSQQSRTNLPPRKQISRTRV